MPPHPAPIGRLWKLWFLGSCSQKACPPPPPSHPPHEVLANRPSGHKVAASLQGSQPGGVTPNRHGQELEHPACGHSLHRGCCSIRLQGLDTSELRKLCKERPGAFPSQDALWELSRWDLLRTLNATLGQALHRLTALQQDFPKARDWLTVTMNIRGFQNNIHCLSQLLRASSETAKPTQASPGASPPPIPASDAFQHKLEGCQFLSGFHRLMGSAGQVFREWGKTPRRSRRHSPRHLALRKGPRGVQLFRRGRRLVPRGQLPR
ncbi:oncostatin-M isoform X1 [Equus asinus]|uniref:oncostatin-M isoform X1 n=1 Tax=Equus asinus TaxID=9793 RepID=UPI0038F68CFE